MKLKRKCLKCGKVLLYKTDEGFKKSKQGTGRCQSCSARQRIIREGKTPHKGAAVPNRVCPICGKALKYISWSAFWNCEAKKTQCIQCAASNRRGVRALEDAVGSLYRQGFTDKEIAAKVIKHESTVKRILRKHGLSTTRKQDALRTRPRADKYRSLNDNFYRRISRRCAQIKNSAGKKGIPFNLTVEILIEQFQSQNGLCFYSDIPMGVKVGEGNGWKQMSIDRVQPGLGYVQDNFVWCTRRINTIKNNVTLDEMKEWMPVWYERIIKFQRVLRPLNSDETEQTVGI